MFRVVLFILFAGFKLFLQAQTCQITMIDVSNDLPVQDVHVFYGNRIAVSDADGVVELIIKETKLPKEISISHISFQQRKMKVLCGDTVLLSSIALSVPELSIISKISNKDLRIFYKNLRSSLRRMTEFKGRGIAENTVHQQNKIGEYKSFIFNYSQDNSEIDDVKCVNAFQHIGSDTIRYFENIHRLLEYVNLSEKKREYNSLLHGFLFERKTWNFDLMSNFQDGRTFYKFSRGDEEVAIEFEGDVVRELSFLNPKEIVEHVERNGILSDGAHASVKLSLEDHPNGGLYISDLKASIDVESGLLTTQVSAVFETLSPYRESIISSIENLGDEYLVYLLLNIDEPLVDLDKIALPNKQQILRFMEDVPPLSTEALLTQFGIISLTDTSQIDTSLQFGEPIYVRPDGNTVIKEYYEILPLIALHALVYPNYKTDSLEMNLFLDPASTRLIQFYESYYNGTWRVKQIEEIKKTTNKILNYLSSDATALVKPSEMSDAEWTQISKDLEAFVSRYLKSSLHNSFRTFRNGKFQNIRLNTKF